MTEDFVIDRTADMLRFIHAQAKAKAAEHETLAFITDLLEAQYPALRDLEPGLTPEGAAKLAAMLSRPGRRIPKLAALLSGKRRRA